MTIRRRSNQKGSAMLESALVLTTFLLTLIGVVDLSQVLFVNQSLTERVRNVARGSAISGASEEEIVNRIVYNSPERPADDVAPAGYLGLFPQHVRAQVLDRTYNEQRLIVEISGLPVTMVSPLMSGRGRNLPLRITVPLEVP